MKASALLLSLLVVGCPRPKAETNPSPSPSDSVAHEEHDAVPRHAKLSKEVVQGARIQTAPATRESLVPTLALPGEIAPDPDRSAKISSPAAGRLVDVRLREGAVVKKGDVLAIVRVPDIGRVKAAQSGTSAKAAAANANADRLQALADKGLAARQEAATARAEADALAAESRALGSEVGALGASEGADISLRAPVSGTVVSRDAVVGQPVSTAQTIATIADLGEIWFLARVFEKDLGRLDDGANAEVSLNAYPNDRFDGKVEYIGKQIDPIARTVTARIRLVNRDELLRIGLFGTARVVAKGEKSGEPVLVVPRTAITEVVGKTVVFVKVGEGEFDMHEVVTGDAAAGKVRILSGLREGEQVVTEGAFTVKSVLLRGTIASED